MAGGSDTLRLFILCAERDEETRSYDWDEFNQPYAFAICAESEQEARLLASRHDTVGDQYRAMWLDEKATRCTAADLGVPAVLLVAEGTG